MGAILSISSPNNIFEWMAFLAEKYSSMFLQGTWITLYVSVIGTIVGFILGYIVGIVGDIKIHKEDNPIKKGIIKFFKFICFLYVELFRGTPMIVQAMIVYFGLRQGGVNINPIIAGILVTVLNTGAYMSETVRAEMANTFLTNLKMTSVLNVIGIQELFMQAKTVGGTYYKYFESYLVIALIYLVLCVAFNRLFLFIEKKMAGKKDYVLAVEYMEDKQ